MRAIILFATISLAGCATIMHGAQQNVGISSTPTGAIVRINGVDAGRTPLIVPLARNRDHIVSITADGYAPFGTTVTRRTSGWVWGNIVFGGLVGLTVDAISGGFWNLGPESVSCVLNPQAATSTSNGPQ